MKRPLVALIGRPNVGKSTLFNRLLRGRRALTHDRPGVTRDRMYGTVRRAGANFDMVDTGGILLDDSGAPQEGPQGLRGFEREVLQQAEEAMAEAHAIALVVDAREGLSPLDQRLAQRVRQSDKPVLLVVNKVDGSEQEDLLLSDFYALGLDMLPVSAEHGYRLDDMVEELEQRVNAYLEAHPDALTPDKEAGPDRPLRLAMLGRPNAGKSSIVNKILGENRMIVSEIAGTTRDSVDVTVDIPLSPEDLECDEPDVPETLSEEDFPSEMLDAEAGDIATLEFGEDAAALYDTAADSDDHNDVGHDDDYDDDYDDNRDETIDAAKNTDGAEGDDTAAEGEETSDAACSPRPEVRRYTFVDTAGVRRRTRIDDPVERFSVQAALASSRRAEVTFFVIDATQGVTTQDKKLISYLDREKTAFIVLINKMDLVPRTARKQAEKNFRDALRLCPHVPVKFVSALTGRGLGGLLRLAERLYASCGVRVSTGLLNRVMAEALGRHQPPVVKRRRAKFYYLTQADTYPPTFVFFVNDPDRVLPSYARYLENQLRKLAGIQYAPIRVHFRQSGDRWGSK